MKTTAEAFCNACKEGPAPQGRTIKNFAKEIETLEDVRDYEKKKEKQTPNQSSAKTI